MRFDAIVIGSGFGGAVSACRLAQAGLRVLIIERGRRYPEGSFPRDYMGLSRGWSYKHEQGLFDIKPLGSTMLSVQSAGYGGGSLVYANVIMRAPADLFSQGWPEGYSRAALDPYYDLVGHMLDIKPMSAQQPKGIPPKMHLMQTSAEKMGRTAQLFHPNLGVDFSEPGVAHPNKFGVPQRGCTHCGECDIGCNQHAKNTLDLNYLALAERHHAVVKTRCEVTGIVPEPDGIGYRVDYKDFAAAADGSVHARHVFVCAGSVNSTELLLRCRDVQGSLPALSSHLGSGYSGNGDFLGMAFDSEQQIDPANGPTITSVILYDRTEGEGKRRIWFLLEDGGAPPEVARIAQILNPNLSWLKAGAHLLWDDLRRAFRTSARVEHVAQMPVSSRSGLFLAMGRDQANGRLHIEPQSGALHMDWDVPANLALYQSEERLVRDMCETLGATPVFSPMWSRLHQPAATHNLGGCPMADSPERGVVSGLGEVFGYPNLFVLDGATLPAAVGVNPSATIAAVAERNIEAIIRRIKGEPVWTAPEMASAVPIHEPLDDVLLPPGASTAAPRSDVIGLEFTETMKGFLSRGFQPADAFRDAEAAGECAGTRMEFTLTITLPDLDAFIADPNKTGIAAGVVHVDGYTAPEGAAVRNGIFNLFVLTDSPDERRMLYALPFIGSDGKPYLLDGFKEVKDHGDFDVWASTTTLYTVIREGHSRSGPVVATGIIHIGHADFAKQLTTFAIKGTRNPLKIAGAYERFSKVFLGSLWQVFVAPKLGGF